MTADPARRRARRRLGAWALLLVALASLALFLAWGPLGDRISPRALWAWFGGLRGHPLAPLALVAGFLVCGLLMLPVTPMIALAAGAFSPLLGFACSLLGLTLLGIAGFAVGRRVGRQSLQRLAGSRMHEVSERLGDAGILAVTMVRIVPVTHFTVVSLTAGASHIRWRDFIAGTVLGMVPGVAAITLLFERARSLLRDPGAGQIAALAAVVAGVLAAALALRAWMRRR